MQTRPRAGPGDEAGGDREQQQRLDETGEQRRAWVVRGLVRRASGARVTVHEVQSRSHPGVQGGRRLVQRARPAGVAMHEVRSETEAGATPEEELTMRFILVVALALGVVGTSVGCKKPTADATSSSAEQPPLCEHGVQKDICTKCNPKLVPVFQAKKDWCSEHAFPESVCPICHPERGGRPRLSTGGKGKEDKDDDDKGKKIQLSDEVIAKAGVRTARVAKEVLAPTVSVPGDIVADPDKSARVTALVAGRLDRVSFIEGARVNKGDLLAVIRVPDIGKARSAFTSTSAKAHAARANADRLRSLADKGLASSQELLVAEAEAEALESETKAASDQLSALGTTADAAGGALLQLRAPLGGVVVSRNAVVGQAVGADQTLASIVELSEVWFLARIYEKEVSRIAAGADAEIRVNALSEKRFAGKVEYVGQQMDPGARTFTTRIRLKNDAALLRVGFFGTATIAAADPSAKKGPTLVVPSSAITEVQGKPVAFVKESGGFERRDLTVGTESIGKVEVLSGVREGEEVVVDGTFTVKSALLKGTMGDDD
ncbi:MAG: efflux RND transporter periplasmic adaptor subunit [Labilithrix sp.]|nr:efflux RND transporter periplasmic adaptor subunit [Labilithrix sp.]MCW5811566.1 efflux RND transporter periplasmic adaptor subunit [Labilithrix sp.]